MKKILKLSSFIACLLAISPSSQALETTDIPLPVEIFQTFCYGSGANYEQVNAMAKAMELEQLPEKYKKALAAPGAVGETYIIEQNSERKQSVMLAINTHDACSIYSQGYGAADVLDFMREEFRLESVAKDDTGLEIREVLIPRPSELPREEKFENGVVTFSYPKDGRGAIISYLAPATAKRLFEN